MWHNLHCSRARTTFSFTSFHVLWKLQRIIAINKCEYKIKQINRSMMLKSAYSICLDNSLISLHIRSGIVPFCLHRSSHIFGYPIRMSNLCCIHSFPAVHGSGSLLPIIRLHRHKIEWRRKILIVSNWFEAYFNDDSFH